MVQKHAHPQLQKPQKPQKLLKPIKRLPHQKSINALTN